MGAIPWRFRSSWPPCFGLEVAVQIEMSSEVPARLLNIANYTIDCGLCAMQTKTSKTESASMPSVDELLKLKSVTEVANKFGKTRPTVCRWIQKGQLPAIRSPFDGRWLIDEADLVDFAPPPPGNPKWVTLTITGRAG